MQQEILIDKEIFHSVEHDIISQWLGIIEKSEIQNDTALSQQDLPAGVVGLKPDMWGELNERSYANAVARIVLSSVQYRLPQWIGHNDQGFILGRKEFAGHSSRVSLLPRFLFEINWATSGPGFPWPAAYYVGYLPYYNAYVVTSSADSPEAFGYNDLAIGFFPEEEEFLESCERIIKADWKEQSLKYGQAHWESLWRTGLLSDNRVNAIAYEVWQEGVEEEWL